MSSTVLEGEGAALVTERVCGSCGERVEQDATACPWCGAAFSGHDSFKQPVGTSAAEPAFGQRSEIAMISIVAVIVIALLVLAGLVLTSNNRKSSGRVRTGPAQSPSSARKGGTGSTSSAPVAASTVPTTVISAPTTLPTTVTSSTLPGQGDVRTEPPGLTCNAIASRGYDYTAAVAYWQSQGQPPRMDVDGNGRPCETVYPPAAVQAFWHT